MRISLPLSLCFGIAHATQYGNNHIRVRPDPPQVEANFPDPGVELLSPAFMNNNSTPAAFSNGTSGPTSEALQDFFIRSLAERNEWLNYVPADYESEEGRGFPYVFLTNNLSGGNASAAGDKVRIWIQGAVHGNEPAGDQAVLALLGKMDANQTWASQLLERADIMILPRYNPDGVAYFQRTLATNFDPNRDHVKLARQQTRDIKKTFSAFAPHVAADMHEYGASSLYGGRYLPGADALFSAAKNLNINAGIRDLSEKLFAPAIGAHLEAAGFRWEPYVTGAHGVGQNSTIVYNEAGSDAKIGRNALGLTQAIVFLFEMRGIGIADQQFARRTATGLAMLEATIQTAVDNAAQVLEVVEGGITDFKSSQEDIIITDSTTSSTRNWTLIDYDSGEVQQVPVTFFSTTPVTANLTKTRPAAYLIPRGWADLADRLKASGLEVETLNHAYSGPVEALTIETSSFAKSYYEGTVLATVTTNSTTRDVELPAGSFWVSTKQKNAALAFVALEPENIDSYVSFNIVPLDVGDEYPVYRVLA
ncbi:Putative peptidase M14, carboxypeptidase A [Septoria linicola]|uniref:Carboxypeptidase M14B n=1 Tax=Septoria linicola TaxID=215465 RepID=A0A9Q9AR14_9PEZI|nr:putative peptidase M14, carboxypeptidase A [Septoria linicola]USW50980.1 Putative peptidase M14, carboxypeptidase A [Septoria linicola]